MTRVSGLLLAAGAGRRMGGPKALLSHGDGRPLVVEAVDALRAGGCEEVVVVLGAEAERAHALLGEAASGPETSPGWPAGAVRAVVADDWERGMAASLATGLWALTQGTPADAVVLMLVDLPDVGGAVVERVVATWREEVGAGSTGHGALLRASYDGQPGHPVLLGHDHQVALAAEVESALREPGVADHGARHYLAVRGVRLVECGDLATGHDVDRPEDLL